MARRTRRRRPARRTTPRRANPATPTRKRHRAHAVTYRVRRRRNPPASPMVAAAAALIGGALAIPVLTKLQEALADTVDPTTLSDAVTVAGAVGALALARKSPAAAGALGGVAGVLGGMRIQAKMMESKAESAPTAGGIELPPTMGGVELPPAMGYASSDYDSIDVGDPFADYA